MKRLFGALALLCGAIAAPQVLAQPVSVTWPLTSGTGWTSSAPSLVTGNPEVVMGGPQIQVFDYWSGQAQRLWAGTSGWAAAPPNPGRYLQFDAVPTPGNQLSVTSVSFNHGGAGINGHVRSEVRYSLDNWSTFTVLAPALVYPHPAMVPFSMTITPPPLPVPSGGKFSLRIYPYTIVDSVPTNRTFASHNSVVINGNSAPGGGGGKTVPFDIRKNMSGPELAGTFHFTVTCSGPGGPYTGPNPVSVTLPTPAFTTVNVPSGSICGIVETQPTPGNWSPPTFSGTGVGVSMGAPWNAKVGPIVRPGGTVLVTNRPPKDDDKVVRFEIRKRIDGPMVPGSYLFTVTCSGPGGPYTGPNPVAVTLPTPGVTAVTVPSGSVCGIVEALPTPGTWSPPTFSGSGVGVAMGAPWNAKVGPITASGGTVMVTNRRKDDGKEGVRFDIRKRIDGKMVAGTYYFTVTCSGPGGPYTGPNPVAVTLPSPGVSTVSVPSGSVCGIVEALPTPGTWSPPTFSGSGVGVAMGAPWNAKVGPITTSGGTVMVTNRRKDDGKEGVQFDIRKRIDGPMVAGTYYFTVTCSGPGGPYTGANPVAVTLPTPGVSTVTVPPGSVCGIVEALPPGTWSPPTFSGNGLALAMGAPWNAKVGPITASGGTVTVTNRRQDDPKGVRFDIRKAINGPMVAGSYDFTVTCSGPGGPYTGPNPVSVVLPSPGVTSVTVPSGSTCGIVETQPATGTWDPPLFGGSGLALANGAAWSVTVGPLTGPGGSVRVTNRPAKVVAAGSCPVFMPNLNVGTMIPSTVAGALNHQTNNGTVEKYCYGDSAANCAIYGGLYEWNEAMGYAAGNNNDLTGARVQGICPAGFHIPSDMEWSRYAWCLESSVAPTGPTPLATFQDQANFTWMGSANPGVGPGDKMKVAFGSFTPPWTGSNASGFGALPAGHRTMSVGTYANLGDWTAFWTATPGNTSTKARYFAVDSPSGSGRVGRNMALNSYGMSVRCMKD